MLSLLLSCLTTVFVFGALAISEHPALRAIGITTGFGVLLAFLFAPGLAAADPEAPEMKRLSLVTLVFLTLTGCTNLYSLSRLPRIEECDLDIPSSERVSGDLLRRLRIHVQAEGASEGLRS